MSNGTVVDGRTVITPQLAKNEEFMYNVFKSYAQHEAGLKGTVSDTQIREAFKMYNAGGVEGYKKLSEQPSAGGQQNTKTSESPSFAHPTGGQGRKTSGFGPRVHPIHGGVSNHAGIDFGLPHGSNVQSFADGKVIFAGKNKIGRAHV